jgi:hypothetical protein
MADNIAEEIVERQERMKSDRGTLESHWQEISERMRPQDQYQFNSNPHLRAKGDKRTQRQFDATPELAVERFASVMESMLTPRNSQWHRLRPSDDALGKNRRVQLWFEEATRLLFKHRYAPTANFSGQNHENFLALGLYGTAAMFIDPLAESPGLRYRAAPISEMYFAENHQGLIDLAFRRFSLTARQIAQKFPKTVPESVMKMLETKPEEPLELIHAVMPNNEQDPTRIDFRGKPFRSAYVLVSERQLLQLGGYDNFPYAISRYVTAPGEVYGRSPAMTALPAVKTLNEQKRAVLKQGHRITDPVLLAHDDQTLDAFDLTPGAVNPGGVNAQGQRLVQALETGNLAAGIEMMNEERAIINDVFLVSLFQILTDNPQMTATEVLERTREKGMLLSPTMGRQQSEMLGPMIEREISLMANQGLLPEMPPELIEAEGEFTVIYDSPLSRAQRAEEASGLFRYMEWASLYTQNTGNPAPWDHIDVDAAAPEIMNIDAVPVKWQSSKDQILAIRAGREQRANEQQAIEAAPALAGLAKAGA